MGDMNVANELIDVHNCNNPLHPSFTFEERNGFK